MATEYKENENGAVIVKTEQEIPAERVKPILKNRLVMLNSQLAIQEKRLAELKLVVSEMKKDKEQLDDIIAKIEAKEKAEVEKAKTTVATNK